MPVIHGFAPSNQLWVTAFDWQGVPRGTVILAGPQASILAPQPHCSVVIGAFSEDDRYAVIAPVVSVAPIRVMDWRAKTEVWHYDFSTGRTMMVAVNPGAGDLAIAIGTEEQYNNLVQDYTYSVVIVHADGSANAIPGKYFWIFPPYADAYPPKGGRS